LPQHMWDQGHMLSPIDFLPLPSNFSPFPHLRTHPSALAKLIKPPGN